jgi:hypothetical protein
MVPRFTAGIRRREAGAAVPEPIGIFEREQAGAPTVALDPSPLGRDVVGGRLPEVA